MISFATFRSSTAALVASLLLCACSGAEWSNVRVAAGYQRPTNGVNVSVVASAEASEEVVSDFTTMLVDALHDDGLEATVDLDSPTSDQLRLVIAEWDPGSQVARYFVGLGAGEGHIVIVVDVKNPRGATILHGRLRGHVSGGPFGGSSKDAARAAARSIADAINTGTAATF
jgi:Domain of unknown function (DUF4410)